MSKLFRIPAVPDRRLGPSGAALSRPRGEGPVIRWISCFHVPFELPRQARRFKHLGLPRRSRYGPRALGQRVTWNAFRLVGAIPLGAGGPSLNRCARDPSEPRGLFPEQPGLQPWSLQRACMGPGGVAGAPASRYPSSTAGSESCGSPKATPTTDHDRRKRSRRPCRIREQNARKHPRLTAEPLGWRAGICLPRSPPASSASCAITTAAAR